MKKINIVREANIGTNLELTNVELTLIKSKWHQITVGLSNCRKLDQELVANITHFSELIDKMIGEDVLSLEETADQLFSSEEGKDVNDIEAIKKASVSGYQDKPGESI